MILPSLKSEHFPNFKYEFLKNTNHQTQICSSLKFEYLKTDRVFGFQVPISFDH